MSGSESWFCGFLECDLASHLLSQDFGSWMIIAATHRVVGKIK